MRFILIRRSTHNSPRLASSWRFFESAVMAMMVFVMLVNMKRFQQSNRAPRFCVAYQAPHAVARDGTHAVAAEVPHAVAVEAPHAVAADGTHAVAGDGSHAVAADWPPCACAAAAACQAQRRGPGPPRTAPRVPHAGGEEKLQSFNAPSRDSPALS